MAVDRTSLVADAVAQIAEFISENRLVPGDPLPSLKELAVRTSYSQSTVREAIKILAAEGRVQSRHGSGTYVSGHDLGEMLRRVLATHHPEPQEVKELLLIQQELVDVVFRMISKFGASGSLGLFSERFEQELASRDWSEPDSLHAVDSMLFEGLAALTGNSVLTGLMVLLRDLSTRSYRASTLESARVDYLAFCERFIGAARAGSAGEALDAVKRIVTVISPQGERQRLTVYLDALGSGSVGGSFFVLGQEISRVLETSASVKVSVKLTGGGVENTQLTESLSMALAIAQGDVVDMAYRGVGAFTEPHTHIRTIGLLGHLYLHVFTRADSGVGSVLDLAGRAVGVGASGGASEGATYNLLREFGLEPGVDYYPKKAAFYDMLGMVSSGEIDAAFFLSSVKNDAIIEAILSLNLRLIGLEPAGAARFVKKNRHWRQVSIPALSYPYQAKELRTVSAPMLLITNSAVSNSFVNLVTRTLHDHKLLWPTSDYLDYASAPEHQGAGSYWEERA